VVLTKTAWNDGMLEYWFKTTKTTLNYPFQQISTQSFIIPLFHHSGVRYRVVCFRILMAIGSKTILPNPYTSSKLRAAGCASCPLLAGTEARPTKFWILTPDSLLYALCPMLHALPNSQSEIIVCHLSSACPVKLR
jgi:hypothetical protein